MSAPPKPWENLQLNRSANLPESLPNGLPSSSNNFATTSTISTNPPPLPPRPTTFSNSSIMQPSYYNSGINSSYPSYGYGSYGSLGGSYGSLGGYGGYGGYNNYGSYGGYGLSNNVGLGAESRFIQLAEESSRPTFQTIESVVRAVTSISAMLDQTFFAMTTSFRAVLGVADSFGRLRGIIAQIWQSLAIFRFLRWILRGLLRNLGIRQFPIRKNVESAWNEALSGATAGSATVAATLGAAAASIESSVPPVNTTNSSSNWPVMLFLSVIVAAPYVISKLFASAVSQLESEEDANTHEVRAIHRFIGNQSSNELSFDGGETLYVYPQHVQQKYNLARSGWLFARNASGQKGIIPANYIRVNKNIIKGDNLVN